MTMTEDTRSLPWHLRGNYAPVTDEVTAFDLPVIGALPTELEGRYLRNGANPKSGTSVHWFAGDGMIHGIRLTGGKAEWYRNRWVRTRALAGEDRMAPDNMGDMTIGLANTHIIGHAGRVLALEEGSFPNELSPELDTLGPFDFGGKLAGPMTAHPHICAETGEMHFFGYSFMPPFLTYHVADADGHVVQSEVIDVTGPTMIHDFAITRNHAVFLDLPVVFDLDEAMRGGMPFHWSDDYPARFGVLRRGRPAAETQWFGVDPCYVFHTMNAFENTDGHVVVDGGRHASMWRGSAEQFEPSYLYRWTLDPASGAVKEEQLDDVSHGFPRLDERLTGLPYRYGYAVAPRPGEEPGMESPSVVVKYDLETGTSAIHDFGPDRSSGEPVFVPASDAAGEDEGWLVTYVYDKGTDSSSFVVLDASDVAAPLVAEVPIPQRIPHGFHGSWIAD